MRQAHQENGSNNTEEDQYKTAQTLPEWMAHTLEQPFLPLLPEKRMVALVCTGNFWRKGGKFENTTLVVSEHLLLTFKV